MTRALNGICVALALVSLLLCPASSSVVEAQAVSSGIEQNAPSSREPRAAQTVGFLAGALTGLAIHEAGHVALDVAFEDEADREAARNFMDLFAADQE